MLKAERQETRGLLHSQLDEVKMNRSYRVRHEYEERILRLINHIEDRINKTNVILAQELSILEKNKEAFSVQSAVLEVDAEQLALDAAPWKHKHLASKRLGNERSKDLDASLINISYDAPDEELTLIFREPVPRQPARSDCACNAIFFVALLIEQLGQVGVSGSLGNSLRDTYMDMLKQAVDPEYCDTIANEALYRSFQRRHYSMLITQILSSNGRFLTWTKAREKINRIMLFRDVAHDGWSIVTTREK